MKNYDVVIIGFGKGGKTLAAELAGRNRSVALIERSDKMYGGTCINIGCIPTKALIRSANLAATEHPLTFEQHEEYYREAVSAKTALVERLRERNYRKLADDPLIDVYTGLGRFLSPRVVEVKTVAETLEITGKEIVINTGAETVLPPIEGIANSTKVYTSTSILDLDRLPRRLVIVGGGYIGLEFASMYAAFGSEVTVLEGFPELMPREDRDIARSVRETLEKAGVRFRLNVKVKSIRDTADGIAVAISQEGESAVIEVDAVLLATGRRPATRELDLEAAGVETDERGAIRVDEHLHTTTPHIYAIGDVTGGLQFTYISLDDYRIVRDTIFGEGARTTVNRGPIPYTVFIEPPLSHVGLHEAEARRAGLDIRVRTIDVSTIPRARILGTPEGVYKAVIDARTDLILGCTLFGPASGEVINSVALAIKHGITARELSGSIYTHPSMSETLNDLFA